MNKGICILVESPDGAGKDTLIENIKKNYPDLDFKVYKFPSGDFRKKIFEKPRSQEELVPLFCEDFRQSIKAIKKDLQDGKNVIINRMYISTLIYALESNVNESFVFCNINDAIGKWRPDLTVLIDIDPKEAFKRLSARADEANWLDGSYDKQMKINMLYKKFFNINWKNLYKSKSGIIQVNANGTKQETFENFNKQFKAWKQKTSEPAIKK